MLALRTVTYCTENEETPHRVFMEAGFDWRRPGCSMCLGANGDTVGRGERLVSTANRSFANRQGPGSRTHIASPALAAASAIAGHIVDPRTLDAQPAQRNLPPGAGA